MALRKISLECLAGYGTHRLCAALLLQVGSLSIACSGVDPSQLSEGAGAVEGADAPEFTLPASERTRVDFDIARWEGRTDETGHRAVGLGDDGASLAELLVNMAEDGSIEFSGMGEGAARVVLHPDGNVQEADSNELLALATAFYRDAQSPAEFPESQVAAAPAAEGQIGTVGQAQASTISFDTGFVRPYGGGCEVRTWGSFFGDVFGYSSGTTSVRSPHPFSGCRFIMSLEYKATDGYTIAGPSYGVSACGTWDPTCPSYREWTIPSVSTFLYGKTIQDVFVQAY